MTGEPAPTPSSAPPLGRRVAGLRSELGLLGVAAVGWSFVLSGVSIGAGTVVEAGLVVTKSLPAGVVAAGSPARIVRERA